MSPTKEPLLPAIPPSPLPPWAAAMHATLHDRTTGVLVGSALGDTIGLYTEFLSAASAAALYPARRFTLAGPDGQPTPFHLDLHRAPKEPRHWTDDTDHALLLLLAYLHTSAPLAQGPLPTQFDFAARLRVWVTQGFRPLDTMPLGLGRLVGSVVSSKGFVEDPEKLARERWESTKRQAAPNGSLMRTHALGVICSGLKEVEAFKVAADISRVTHVDPRCVVSCVIGTGLVRAVVRGEVRDDGTLIKVVERAVDWFKKEGKKASDGDVVWDELWKHVKPEGGLDGLKLDDQATMGYVFKTLGSGVVLLRMAIGRAAASRGGFLDRSRVFEELITDLIMRGGDADTNACFAGALLGGYLGYSWLPDHWKHGLKHEEWLLGKADALSEVLGYKEGEYSGRKDKDTEVQGGRPALSQEQMEARWMVLQQSTGQKIKKIEDTAKASSSKAVVSKTSSSKSFSLSWAMPWHSRHKE